MKKIYLLALVFMFVVSVSSVCAADNNTTDTGVEINNTGVVDTPTYNFKSIQDDIDSGKQKIDLTGDYLRDNRDKDIVVKGNVTIDGHGHKIDAQNKGGIFKLDPKSNLTLINLTLMNGLSNIGSAIDVKDSTINANNVKFVGNVATLNGGAIYLHVNSKGNLNNVEFESNAAKTAGGSIYSNQNATLNVNNTVFTKNYAPERGGAIYAYENHMGLSNVTIRDNEARRGAGIYAIGDFILNIDDSEFIDNHAVDEAGAIGLYRGCGYVMNNVTLKGNQAISGAGIYAERNSILNVSDAKLISNKKLGTTRECISNGGAIHLGDNSKGFIRNVSFCDNFSTSGSAIYSAANCVLNVSDAKFVNNLVVIGDHTYDLYKCLGTVYLGSKSEGYFNNVSLYV